MSTNEPTDTTPSCDQMTSTEPLPTKVSDEDRGYLERLALRHENAALKMQLAQVGFNEAKAASGEASEQIRQLLQQLGQVYGFTPGRDDVRIADGTIIRKG